MTNDIRTKSIAFLNAAKSALAYNSKPGFQALMKTFSLPANPWIPSELEAIKVIEVIGDKASCAKEWRWVSKDSPEQIFDALVLHRRKGEAMVVHGLDALVEMDVRNIAKATAKSAVEGWSGNLTAKINAAADALNIAMFGSLPVAHRYSEAGLSLLGEINEMRKRVDFIEKHSASSLGFAQFKAEVEKTLATLALSRDERPPAAELLEMAINDLSSLSQRMASLEGNVTAVMREVFKHLPAGVAVVPAVVAPPVCGSASQSANRKALRIGVLGPWQRDWRYVLESVRHQDDVLVMIDRDVRPVRVVKGFDYVVIAADCTASAVEYRQAYGERAQVCPAGGMKRIAAFVDELIERHDKGAKSAA